MDIAIFSNDLSMVFHEHLSAQILHPQHFAAKVKGKGKCRHSKTEAKFLDIGQKGTNLIRFRGRIGKTPEVITKSHDFLIIVLCSMIFHDLFHFPGFQFSVGTLPEVPESN